MAATVIQAGSTLKMLDEDGVVTPLVLPTGVTLRNDVKPRFTTNNNFLVIVNTPSQPLIVDSTGIVRLLCPKAPRLAATLSAVAGGTLTGNYKVQYTFVTMDAIGNIISESDYSPLSAQQAVSNQFLKAAGLDISPDQISRRRLYRTTNNGVVMFQWVDLDGNVQTSVQDDLADAGLSLTAAPILGTPPRLTHVAEFRGRLFGVGDLDIDHLRYTEAGVQYAWPEDNIIPIGQVGADTFGITGLIPRREALGVGRRNMLLQITGSGAEDGSGNIDFDTVILSRECGIESQETVKVHRDVAYFLWKDGVYSWGPEGVRCISDGTPDGKGQVRTWFVTDQFFNRDQFQIAFAHIDLDHPHYRLFLCSAGSDVIDRFIEYDINEGTWWGPHKTDLFTPTSAFNRVNADDRVIPVVGGAQTVYEEQETRTDGASTPIAFDITSKQFDGNAPDVDKVYGELSVFGEGNQTGALVVTTRVGDLDSNNANYVDKVQYYDLAKSRQRLGRPGHGKHCRVNMTDATAGRDLVLYGFEMDPVTLVGRR
jgi:hypothetical protein